MQLRDLVKVLESSGWIKCAAMVLKQISHSADTGALESIPVAIIMMQVSLVQVSTSHSYGIAMNLVKMIAVLKQP